MGDVGPTQILVVVNGRIKVFDKNGVQSGEPFGGIDPKFDITVPISKAIDKLL